MSKTKVFIFLTVQVICILIAVCLMVFGNAFIDGVHAVLFTLFAIWLRLCMMHRAQVHAANLQLQAMRSNARANAIRALG